MPAIAIAIAFRTVAVIARLVALTYSHLPVLVTALHAALSLLR
jgi:hypothetical protein